MEDSCCAKSVSEMLPDGLTGECTFFLLNDSPLLNAINSRGGSLFDLCGCLPLGRLKENSRAWNRERKSRQKWLDSRCSSWLEGFQKCSSEICSLCHRRRPWLLQECQTEYGVLLNICSMLNIFSAFSLIGHCDISNISVPLMFLDLICFTFCKNGIKKYKQIENVQMRSDIENSVIKRQTGHQFFVVDSRYNTVGSSNEKR